MAIGAMVGPAGVVVGGILGGIISGIGSNLVNRYMDSIIYMQLTVDFKVENYSQVDNGYLKSEGERPNCKWKNIKENAKSMILIG